MRYFTGLDRVLLDCIESGDAAPYLQLMKKFGVQTIESELRCLEPEFGSSPDLLLAFLKVTKIALLSHKDYELTQSYLALFLKVSKSRSCRLAKFPYIYAHCTCVLQIHIKSMMCMAEFLLWRLYSVCDCSHDVFTVKFNIHLHVPSVLLSNIDVPVTPPYSIGK